MSATCGTCGHAAHPVALLSTRERQVLELMAEGRSNAGIARTLWIGEGTVEKHVKHVLMKLRISDSDDDHRRVLAVLLLLRYRAELERHAVEELAS